MGFIGWADLLFKKLFKNISGVSILLQYATGEKTLRIAKHVKY
jgi:hypothetical protein